MESRSALARVITIHWSLVLSVWGCSPHDAAPVVAPAPVEVAPASEAPQPESDVLSEVDAGSEAEVGGSKEPLGRLPAKLIQEAVRTRYLDFRKCYEPLLAKQPDLEGNIAVRFVIERDGGVSNVSVKSSTLPETLNECVLAAFRGLEFPAPDGGIVTVVYPIKFSPG